MGFGRSSTERQNDAQVKGISNEQKAIAEASSGRADKAFNFFKKSAKPAMNFWSDILSGDRNSIMQLLGPEISTVKDTFKGERDSNTALTPRSGMRASGYTDSANKEASTIDSAVLKARPTAAEQLAQLAGLFGGVSGQQTGLALTGFGDVTSNLFGLNKEQADQRATQANFWGSLGQGAGSIIGGLLLKGGGGGD